MQVMKRIVKSDTTEITIKIPEEFKGKEIEIIILPFESTKNISTKVSKKERLKGLLSVSKGVLPADYKFDREEAHERWNFYRFKHFDLFYFTKSVKMSDIKRIIIEAYWD